MDEEIIVLFGFIEDKEKQTEDLLKNGEVSKEEKERYILDLKTIERLLKRLPSVSNVNGLESSIRKELARETKSFNISCLNRELEFLLSYQQSKTRKKISVSQK